jgi:hypothetical protein
MEELGMTTAINTAATSKQSNLSQDRELCKPPLEKEVKRPRVVRMDSVAQAARLDRELREDQLNAVSGGGGLGGTVSSIGKAISSIGKDA